MKIHLIDGTYELFRAYYGAPKRKNTGEREVGAAIGFCRSMLLMLRQPDTTHIACAFDHVIESFRNRLFAGYKTGEGIDPELLQQFPLVEQAGRALGLVVWPMVEFEADDALATAAMKWKARSAVDQIVLCSPDKDLAQCVRANRIVCEDRRRKTILDEDGVWKKFGVAPASIPDYLGLVGDSADGIPGLPGWGAKSASRVLAHYRHLERIPHCASDWEVKVSRAGFLATVLRDNWEAALLYRNLASLRTDVPIGEELEDLCWNGVDWSALKTFCQEVDAPGLQDAARSLPR